MAAIDPWRHVDADDDLVADLLAATIEIVCELGGSVHPDAVLVARHGHLHVTCGATEGHPLLVLPREVFLPIGQVTWSSDAERLEIVDIADGLAPAQVELLVLQTALHNACGKSAWLARSHPVLAPDLAVGVVDAVRAFRPSFRRQQPTTASLLWSTRCFRLPFGESGEAVPVALPLIDLIDHRSGGATGTWTGQTFGVATSHPAGDEACFLDYGLQRDAIGMAVVYGFADDSAALAHSAPLRVQVPSVGRVEVLARGRSRSGELQDLVVHLDVDGARISHLTFRPGGTSALESALAKASGWPAHRCHEVVLSVAERNVQLLDALVDAASLTVDAPAARILAAAALHQREVVHQAVAPR